MQTFVFLLQTCAFPTLCAVCLVEETAKRGWRAPGWWSLRDWGAWLSMHEPASSPFTWRVPGTWGTPSTKTQQHMSEVLLVHHSVSQRPEDKVPHLSEAL